jgi:hypothetical protein
MRSAKNRNTGAIFEKILFFMFSLLSIGFSPVPDGDESFPSLGTN